LGYTLEASFQGYDAGTELRDVTLDEARAMECNRCGDCCSGMRPGVKKDGPTGLPLFTWGTKFPEDRYAERYGIPLLNPVVEREGILMVGEDWERDADGKPYTCFSCAFLREHAPSAVPETSCALYGLDEDPEDLSTWRPRNCGDFPVFGQDLDDAMVSGNTFIVPTGALPRCTWYGLRVVGPWKDTPFWRDRWERQQAGEEVEDLLSDENKEKLKALAEQLTGRRQTEDGSTRKVVGDAVGGVPPGTDLGPTA